MVRCRWRPATGIWVPGYSVDEDAQSGPEELKASESLLGNLSREARWVAFIPVGNGPVECDVGQHRPEDSVVLCLVNCVARLGSPIYGVFSVEVTTTCVSAASDDVPLDARLGLAGRQL